MLILHGNSFNGNDTVTFSIPVSYSYSENIDITASFSAVNNDDFIHTTTSTTQKLPQNQPLGELVSITNSSLSHFST
jgi:hypothetical protein